MSVKRADQLGRTEEAFHIHVFGEQLDDVAVARRVLAEPREAPLVKRRPYGAHQRLQRLGRDDQMAERLEISCTTRIAFYLEPARHAASA
ncbi:hypothetical protein [Burkholderia mayonis]|uniref:Uncharacterized protein n=1 Tax=Burkholderia mayonis TaxID=1385591 RepID=A0A1B4FXT5_9BURK|nr:hypothetical protein [Burkholderia mayonis]AOJ08431.1 hypothetical protein WS71_13335 [Burkholderia mayonis]KVE52885.1 hypothetical protein WS71_08900 [Burkholderia mayonis]